ncbi:potassium transporter KtrB, partial [[Ruminococcus] lactaris]|nr:potassium transporter KtrB [[Ruminococcus] lactaris]
EEEWAARKLRLSTMQIVALGFMGIILAGGLLLWLPFSNRQPISFLDALFTAVTCVCVTGLVTVVPATQFTLIDENSILQKRNIVHLFKNFCTSGKMTL